MKNTPLNSFERLIKPIVGLLLSTTIFISPVSLADEEAIALLNRMNQALHQLTYKGTLAYLREGSLSTLLVDHTVNSAGVENERVVRLNESGGEVSRKLTGFSLASIPRIKPEMQSVYSFDMGRRNKIANIPCVIITARPKDRNRYLQKYCIDTSTGMLLDYMLVGKSHKAVEQFMFTSIEIRLPEGRSVSEQACANKTCSNDLDLIRSEVGLTNAIVDQSISDKAVVTNVVSPPVMSMNTADSVIQVLDDGWVMEALPAGYGIRQAPSLIGENVDGQQTKHYVVSDGLSSLSVFVAPLSEDMPTGSVEVNSGALNVVSQRKSGHVITVVGEVPEGTLKDIVRNLRKK